MSRTSKLCFVTGSITLGKSPGFWRSISCKIPCPYSWVWGAPVKIIIGIESTYAVAAPVTYLVSVQLDHGPVVASAVVGLAAGLVCPPLFAAGDAVAAVAFCASFAGMATPERIPGPGAMLLAGGTAGVAFVGAAPYFVGFGGKLGTIAFAACLVTAGALSLGRLLAPAGSDAVTG